MKSLNSSLPGSSSQNRRKQPNSELLQAFKAAALSVTQLYKTAATEEDSTRESHSVGYLGALDDLLTFLDERNLGLGDGEGWQVREWATQRHQSLVNFTTNVDNEIATSEEEDKGTRSTSPTSQPKPNPQYVSTSVQTEPTSPKSNIDSSQRGLSSPQVFHFQSPTTLPPQQSINIGNNMHTSPAVRFEVVPRSARGTQHRNGHHSRAADRMPAVSLGSLGHGAGSKRKLPLHEFFDVGGLGGGKDGYPPGKRGRML